MRRILFLVTLGIAGAYFFRLFIFEGIYLATGSMAPTLPQGTHVMVNKFSPHVRSFKRGDVVMFEIPQKPAKGLVKRIVALPGETIELRQKVVYINGAKLDEPYVQYVRALDNLVDDNLPPMVVPQNHVFVMGDNRDVSNDSRDWKDDQGNLTPFLPMSNIQGVVIVP